MKKLIFISFFLNLGLLGAVAYFSAQSKESASLLSVAETKEKKAHGKSMRPRERTQTLVINEMGERFDWRQVESADYRAYIANLRRIHCPEETIRDIIIADVNKFYAEQLRPLRKPPEEFRYWRNERNGGSRRESDEYYAAQKKIEKEKRVLLKELLDTDYEELMAQEYGGSKQKDPFYAKLSQETKDKMSEIQEKFGLMQSEIYRKAKGYIDQDTQNELKKIEKDQTAELAKILSPEEVMEWQLRNSRVAQELKWNGLQGFGASEEEFRAVFAAKLASQDMDAENRNASAKNSKEIQDTLKTALGEDRYKDYVLNQNYDYRQLTELAERQGVGKEEVQRVYAMKDDVQKAARQINADNTLTQDQKREKLLDIKAATEKEVTATFGERGFKKWKNDAWWLRSIVPPAPKPVSP